MQSYNKFEDIHLSGYSIKELEEEHKINRKHLNLYIPAKQEELEKNNNTSNKNALLLNYNPQSNFYYAIENKF